MKFLWKKILLGLILKKVLPNAEIHGLAMNSKAKSELSGLLSQLKTKPGSSKFFVPLFVLLFTVIFESVNFAFDLKIQNFKEVMWSN